MPIPKQKSEDLKRWSEWVEASACPMVLNDYDDDLDLLSLVDGCIGDLILSDHHQCQFKHVEPRLRRWLVAYYSIVL